MEGGRWSMSKKMWKVTSLDRMLPLHCLGEERRIRSAVFLKDFRGLGTNVFTTQQCNHCLIKDSKGSEV